MTVACFDVYEDTKARLIAAKFATPEWFDDDSGRLMYLWSEAVAAGRVQALAEVEAQRFCWVCEGTGHVWSTTPGLPPFDCDSCATTGSSKDITQAVEAVREAGPR